MTFQGRYDCCFRSLMVPMHQRMIEDGIKLVLRGQRRADTLKAPIQSGWVDPATGITYVFPLDDLGDSDVWSYLAGTWGLRLPESYDYCASSIDCLHCTAYWNEPRGAYLRARHPDVKEHVDHVMLVAWNAIKRTVNAERL
jgi:phosphoadenosine phosphosulfate reductase